MDSWPPFSVQPIGPSDHERPDGGSLDPFDVVGGFRRSAAVHRTREQVGRPSAHLFRGQGLPRGESGEPRVDGRLRAQSGIRELLVAVFFSLVRLQVCATSAEDPETEAEVEKAIKSGERHISVLFERDGHFLQKTRAVFLADAIAWLLKADKKSS